MNSNRDELLAGRTIIDFDDAETDQRTRLLSGTETLNNSSQRLQNSHRLALETETLGAGILTDLRTQREQILNTRNTLREADSNVHNAQSTLKEMSRRMLHNKFIKYAIIIVLIAIILLIIYLKFF
jgi:vesicle transport through interaction with t-SNAREs protein 1